MQTREGIAVSPGVAIESALVLDVSDQAVPRRSIAQADVEAQCQRLEEAISSAIDELNQLREHTASSVGEKLAGIFAFHVGMLQDKSLTDQFRQMVETERVTAEYAVYAVVSEYTQRLSSSESRYMRERVSDMWDIERRLIRQLTGDGVDKTRGLDHEAIVVARDLTPSQTAALDKSKIKALATDVGGRTSHTAILAHALGIPAVVGLGDITSRVSNGQTLIVDGNAGVLVIDPDAAQLMEYRQEVHRLTTFAESLGELRELPAATKDGTEISLQANIEFPDEIAPALANGAVGIGLYRTEFQFLAAEVEPSEDEQYGYFVEAINALEGRPLTIRTLDLGADKVSPAMGQWNTPSEPNPFLGVRSIRLCLQHLDLFKTQLRAILRASAHGPVRIMFPLISHIMEMRQAKMVLADVREDLDDARIDYDEHIPLGMMIEVPSAALQARSFSTEADFFSIGTNDLIQYTVAADRSNERIASLYSAGHPAVLALIRETVKASKRQKTDVSLCGEMAGQPEFTMLLLGLGLRSLSITPPAIPEIKKIIRSVSIDQCQRLARKVGSFESDRQVVHYLRDQVSRIMPEVFGGRSTDK